MRFAVTFFFSLWAVLGTAQVLSDLEEKMAILQNEIGSGATDKERREASDKLEAVLTQAFEAENSFEYPFEKLFKIGMITSADEAFRIFNWNIPLDDGSNAYRLYFLFPDGDFLRAEDTRQLTRELQYEELSSNQWYGALYYEIHPVKLKRKTIYTLLGWDGNDPISTKKVLDVIDVGKKNQVSFGFPLFETEEGLAYRRVFEYAEDVVMTLRWLEPKEMIVFDKLEPRHGALQENHAFYGPSTTYSGYQWNGEYWKLHDEVDMRRPQEPSGAQFNFPDRPDFNRKREEKNPLIKD